VWLENSRRLLTHEARTAPTRRRAKPCAKFGRRVPARGLRRLFAAAGLDGRTSYRAADRQLEQRQERPEEGHRILCEERGAPRGGAQKVPAVHVLDDQSALGQWLERDSADRDHHGSGEATKHHED